MTATPRAGAELLALDKAIHRAFVTANCDAHHWPDAKVASFKKQLAEDGYTVAALTRVPQPAAEGGVERAHMVACLRDRDDKLCSDAANEIERLAAVAEEKP